MGLISELTVVQEGCSGRAKLRPLTYKHELDNVLCHKGVWGLWHEGVVITHLGLLSVGVGGVLGGRGSLDRPIRHQHPFPSARELASELASSLSDREIQNEVVLASQSSFL